MMEEKALRYLMEEQAMANTYEVHGETYSDKKLYRVNHNPKAAAITMNTLSSLVDYIKCRYDDRSQCFVHVVSPTKVQVYSILDADREREYLVEVNAEVPAFEFNTFIDHERFLINLQAKFANNEDRALLLKFAGTVESGSIAEYGDDGITQKATVRNGIASKTEAVVPNPVNLIPVRTFVEVEQPESAFIFRMKQAPNGSVQCAIFEADGGAWKIEAKAAIKKYLEEQLEGEGGIVVIA